MVKGPKGQMNYNADLALKLGMIAGGTWVESCFALLLPLVSTLQLINL